MSFIIEAVVSLIVLWFVGIAAIYAAFTTSYLLAALGWQTWKKGKALWKRI